MCKRGRDGFIKRQNGAFIKIRIFYDKKGKIPIDKLYFIKYNVIKQRG
jgi:hypothetical protein